MSTSHRHRNWPNSWCKRRRLSPESDAQQVFLDMSTHIAAVCTVCITDRSICQYPYQYAIPWWPLIINNTTYIKINRNIKKRKLRADQVNPRRNLSRLPQAVPNQSPRKVPRNHQSSNTSRSLWKLFRPKNLSLLILLSKERPSNWSLSGSEFGGSAGATDNLKYQQQWINSCSLSIIATKISSVS